MHADFVKLGDVEFRVRKGGKEKVRAEKSKNVHAFVIGNLLDYCQYPCENMPSEPTDRVVTYNPYKYDSFVYKADETPVYKAKEVDNPLVANHAKQTKHQKYEKRILTFRNEQKRKSKPGDALKRENRQSRNTSQSDVRWR